MCLLSKITCIFLGYAKQKSYRERVEYRRGNNSLASSPSKDSVKSKEHTDFSPAVFH